MERLTERGFKFTSSYVASKLQSWSIAECLAKLQAYEDAEEQGTLYRLPCIGNKVYRVWTVDGRNTVATFVIKNILIGENYSFITVKDECAPYKERSWALSELGKTYFITREEVETALDQMRWQEHE